MTRRDSCSLEISRRVRRDASLTSRQAVPACFYQGKTWAAALKGIEDSAQGFNREFYTEFVGWNQ